LGEGFEGPKWKLALWMNDRLLSSIPSRYVLVPLICSPENTVDFPASIPLPMLSL
jgi:hypothetical protein